MASKYFKAFSYLTKGIGGTKKSDKIKEAVGIKKKVEKLEKQSEASIKKGKTMLSRSDMVEPTKNLRDIKRTKRQADKFVKETMKEKFAKGGVVGGIEKLKKKGPKDSIKEKILPKKKKNRLEELRKELGMKKGGKAKFPDLTGDGKVTRADILKGRGVFRKGGASK